MITGTLALLIFDRNLILMLYPVITCIWSISVSQKCESLWPGRSRSLRQKNLKIIAKTFTSGNKPTSTKLSINYQTKNQNYPYWITGLEKLVYAPFNPKLLGALWLVKEIFQLKKTYLKLRFMCQDMPRMQDFSPFTPELLGAFRPPAVRTTSQASWASLLCGLDWTTKQFFEQPKFLFRLSKWLTCRY